MSKHRVLPLPGLLWARFIYMVLTVSIMATLVAYPGATPGSPNANVAHAGPVHMPPSTVNRDLFGMVIRDPFYEYNTDPVNFKDAPNRTALEQEAREIASAGAKWIRMEFCADYDGSVQPGDINWAKYDWFINELAPRYGLKVLALLNVGMVSYNGQTVRTLAFNDPPDNGGSNPGEGLPIRSTRPWRPATSCRRPW